VISHARVSRNNHVIYLKMQQAVPQATRKSKRLLELDQQDNNTAHPKKLCQQERAHFRELWQAVCAHQTQKRIENITLSSDDLLRLRPGEWLNDEVINAYLHVLSHPYRQSQCVIDLANIKEDDQPTPLRLYAFSSFFYPALEEGGHAKVANWTVGIDLFEYHLIFVPCHVTGNHWCLAVINVPLRRIDYYDSLYERAHCVNIKLLKQYMCLEHQKNRGDDDMEEEEWHWLSYEPRNTVPQQNNASDCGVFLCQFASALARQESVKTVKASDMSFYRKKMVLDLLSY